MRLKKDSSKQKLRGAYYTPQKLANAMVRLFASENIDAVLEPSCGDGVFLDALKETGLLDKVSRVEAVEIETPEAQKVSGRYKDTPKVKVINRDFFDFYKETLGKKTYDLILGNPPYIRYQYLKERKISVFTNSQENNLVDKLLHNIIQNLQGGISSTFRI